MIQNNGQNKQTNKKQGNEPSTLCVFCWYFFTSCLFGGSQASVLFAVKSHQEKFSLFILLLRLFNICDVCEHAKRNNH